MSQVSKKQLAGICALLVVLVFLVFGQTLRNGFVYDDTIYVTGNSVVQKGVTLHGIIWSLTYGEIGHWHPLTWITHMLDCQFYGLWAGGHHLTNVILHAAAVVLLFLALFQMTGALWRCAFVAAAWAVHPLRVESVAWISERKDVLSGVFFMLGLWAYVRWVRQPSARRYFLLAVVFALGLMSKNMLVTFPCVLLLLDYWPLCRLNQRAEFPRLLKEKIPIFALSVISCVITFLVPEEIKSASHLPFWVRAQNALVSYCIYLWQSVWPAGLAADYPNPTHAFALWQLAGALALLGVLSFAVFKLRKRHPYLPVGWLWFIGMLTPVIGLVQISYYAHADRYTYLPQIGLWIAGTWMAADWAGCWRNHRALPGTVAAVILCGLSVGAWHQVSYWHDNISLWTRVLECDPTDSIAHNNLGISLLDEGKTDEAVAHYRESLRLNSDYDLPHFNLGIALEKQGHEDEAMAEYREALRINPNYAKAHNNLGYALYKQGRIQEAIDEYHKALETNPEFVLARDNLDNALSQEEGGNRDDAGVHNNFGNALLQQGQIDEAITHFQAALKLNPDYAEAHNSLGNAFILKRRIGEAIAEYREAVRVKHDYANAHYNLGNALFRVRQEKEAIQQLQQALQLQPGNATFQNDLALMLSTSSQTSLRNGARALELATAANQSVGGNDPMILRTLAAAYAETGDFSNAAQTARKALQMAESRSSSAAALAAGALGREIKFYEAGRRFESAH